MDEKESPQFNLWTHELEKFVIQVKLKTALIVLAVLLLLLTGYGLGVWNKHSTAMKAQRFGYNSAILDYPGAGLAQSGVTFCQDKGNYYRTKRLNNWTFTIGKDQSVPQIKKEE